MRTIKFRGLRVDGKGWAVGSRIELNDSKGKRVFTVPIEEEVVTINGKEHFHWDGLIEVKPETVGQFTGLTDKNGRDIWEGDKIVGSLRGKHGTVVFCDSCFYVVWDDEPMIQPSGKNVDIEITGTIHTP